MPDELESAAGPGALERQLARVAAKWAALNAQQPLDALFAHRPAAWVAPQAGGEDALVVQLLAQAAVPAAGTPGLPCLVLDTDAPAQDPFAATVALPAPRVQVCDDLESEAQAAAAQVITALNAGAQRVALVTQDRLLARRIRSLLERQGHALDGETGWKLATTRAAAALMAWLRAAAIAAPADAWLDWLDWLKAGACPAHHAQGLEALEALRRRGAQLGTPVAAPASAAALWRRAEQALAGLALPASLSASAIEALRECPYRFFATRVLGLGEIEERPVARPRLEKPAVRC